MQAGLSRFLVSLAIVASLACESNAQVEFLTSQPPQLRGDTDATNVGWTGRALFSVADTVNGYVPPGILDGIGAFALNDSTVRLLVNHELGFFEGHIYPLDTGLELRGARVSYFDVHRTRRILVDAGIAYDTIMDRAGNAVVDDVQINEGTSSLPGAGIDRLCSSVFVSAGTFGLVDDIYFAGEETSSGQMFALDVFNRTLHAVPQMGRAAFENIAPLDPGTPDDVAFLIGDDRQAAPLYLYLGRKNELNDGSFLDRNGLSRGDLFVWVADNGDRDPQAFNGTGNTRAGTFKKIPNFNLDNAGITGWDSLGYALQGSIDSFTQTAGAFQFSRPEDVAVNPLDGTQAVFASTGRGSRFPADDWGSTYLVDVDFSDTTATLTILYDGDDAGNGLFTGSDFGIRNPDNLDWASNGKIYIQEDRSTSINTFGGVSGVEASVWELDPVTGTAVRILEMDRSAIPNGLGDTSPTSVGAWESSGVLDVTTLFDSNVDEVVLAATVQAHTLRGSLIGGAQRGLGLVESAQLLLLSSNEPVLEATEKGVELIGVSVFPNPARERLEIRMSGRRQATRIALHDVIGRVIISRSLGEGTTSHDIDIVDLPAGVYFLSVQRGQETAFQKVTIY